MRVKLILILATVIFLLLVWVLVLSAATAPMVVSSGVWKCVAYAVAISLVCAWLLVEFIIELRIFLDKHS